MSPVEHDEARWWLEQAESDLSAVEVLFDAGKFDLVCFLSQQVAEKALKAYLFSQGEDLIVTHSITRLCDMCSRYEPSFQDLKKRIRRLTPYYVEARYPNALEEIPARYFNEEDAREAADMAPRPWSS